MWHISRLKPVTASKPDRLAPLAALLVMLVCIAALTGCGPTTHRYLDNKDVEIEKVESRMEGDHVVVYAELRNSSSGDVNNSVYRVVWFDADDFRLGETAWKPLQVKGGATMYVREVSTIPGTRRGILDLSNDSRKP